jgi:2-polyprenyl-6-methoxyphenol hydroxylase-like FAD-dependent oxidoreductase
MAEQSHFRAVIVGGGPVGLVAAHIFAAAGIDFVLLEQRETIVPQQGAGIVLFPHTQRVFDQLGLMGRLREIGLRFDSNQIVNGWGWNYNTVYTNKWTEEK